MSGAVERRRRVALASAAVIALLAVSLAASPLQAGIAEPRPLVVDLTGYEDRTVAASPAQLTAPEQAQGIGPGSHLLITGIPGAEDRTFGCTANFVWQAAETFYLGAAGHCFLPGDGIATHGPGADSDLAGVRVRVCADHCSWGGQVGFFIEGWTVPLGPVVYARQTGPEGDVGNDFGLVEVPVKYHRLLRPAVPVFGGPVDSGAMWLGDAVCQYGAGVVAGEAWPTMGRAGIGLGTVEDEGWWNAEIAVTPGDSGSPIQVCDPTLEGLAGRAAAGIVTHIALGTGVTWGTTVDKAVEMAREAELDISLVLADGGT